MQIGVRQYLSEGLKLLQQLDDLAVVNVRQHLSLLNASPVPLSPLWPSRCASRRGAIEDASASLSQLVGLVSIPNSPQLPTLTKTSFSASALPT